MGIVEWSAIGGVVIAVLAILRFVTHALDRLNGVESKASGAQVSVAAARLDLERIEAELVSHRVAVAEKYVSKEMLASLETRIVDAINRLGDRLDKMFTGTHR